MRTPFPIPIALGVGALAFALGCTTAPRESTIQGTAALSTFPSAPSAIAARDEAGRVRRADVDPQGQFALRLLKGHTYRVSLEGAAGSVPIVFPRGSGRLDASFALHTNGALLELGQVRYYPGAPASGFHVLAVLVGDGAAGSDCIDCVSDDQHVTCDASEGESTGVESSTSASDTAEQADANAEMAIGDQNVPEQVSGCDDQGGDNVDQQQEGEH
jgi:hypothetical protein